MAAPEYVPVKPIEDVRSYQSPPRRPEPWIPSRPGDLARGHPKGDLFGFPGPDQGYALKLAHRFHGRLTILPGEHQDDVELGCVAVALKRASLFGRAPVIHDLTVAFTIWGYLGAGPHEELVTLRQRLFLEASNPLHYLEQRRIVDATPDDLLTLPPDKIAAMHKRDWRSLLLDEAL